MASTPTSTDVFWMAAGTRPKTAGGMVTMIATHSLPASSAGAIAAPFGRPDSSVMSRVDMSVVPAKAEKNGKSSRQLVRWPRSEPNSRARSGWMR